MIKFSYCKANARVLKACMARIRVLCRMAWSLQLRYSKAYAVSMDREQETERTAILLSQTYGTGQRRRMPPTLATHESRADMSSCTLAVLLMLLSTVTVACRERRLNLSPHLFPTPRIICPEDSVTVDILAVEAMTFTSTVLPFRNLRPFTPRNFGWIAVVRISNSVPGTASTYPPGFTPRGRNNAIFGETKYTGRACFSPLESIEYTPIPYGKGDARACALVPKIGVLLLIKSADMAQARADVLSHMVENGLAADQKRRKAVA